MTSISKTQSTAAVCSATVRVLACSSAPLWLRVRGISMSHVKIRTQNMAYSTRLISPTPPLVFFPLLSLSLHCFVKWLDSPCVTAFRPTGERTVLQPASHRVRQGQVSRAPAWTKLLCPPARWDATRGGSITLCHVWCSHIYNYITELWWNDDEVVKKEAGITAFIIWVCLTVVIMSYSLLWPLPSAQVSEPWTVTKTFVDPHLQ